MTPKELADKQQKTIKRMRAHSQTIGIWLASTAKRNDGETDRAFAERLIALGAWHAMKPCNAPLLTAITAYLPGTEPTQTGDDKE